MACATLKRSLEWEPILGTRPAKRRRCSPFCASPQHHKDRSSSSSHSANSHSTPPQPQSVFPDVISQKLTPEYMAASIKAELRRIRKHKQLDSSSSDNSDGSSSGGEHSESPSFRKEKPLFTFKQVGLICERMLRERETEIREEYDSVLTTKLAEQYDAFVRFTYDQIQRNYQEAPSYLS